MTTATELRWELSDRPHITARERADLDRHRAAMAQAQAAGLTALRDAYTANA